MWYIYFLILSSVLALFDSVLTLNTIYFDESKGLIFDRYRIVKHYISKELFLDFTLIIPLDTFIVMIFEFSR